MSLYLFASDTMESIVSSNGHHSLIGKEEVGALLDKRFKNIQEGCEATIIATLQSGGTRGHTAMMYASETACHMTKRTTPFNPVIDVDEMDISSVAPTGM